MVCWSADLSGTQKPKLRTFDIKASIVKTHKRKPKKLPPPRIRAIIKSLTRTTYFVFAAAAAAATAVHKTINCL